MSSVRLVDRTGFQPLEVALKTGVTPGAGPWRKGQLQESANISSRPQASFRKVGGAPRAAYPGRSARDGKWACPRKLPAPTMADQGLPSVVRAGGGVTRTTGDGESCVRKNTRSHPDAMGVQKGGSSANRQRVDSKTHVRYGLPCLRLGKPAGRVGEVCQGANPFRRSSERANNKLHSEAQNSPAQAESVTELHR